jgi:hypothetical protein
VTNLRIEGAEDWRRLAVSLRGAEAPVRRAIRKGLRDTAKPLGEEMRDGGADRMPRRGGLSARVARTAVTLRTAGGVGAGARVEVALRSRDGYDLPAMDRGSIRHPVFGRGPWVAQSVPARGFSDAFDRGAPKVRRQLLREIDRALDEIGD